MRTLAKLLCVVVALPTLAWAEPSASPQPDKLRDALTEMVVSVTKTVGEGKAFVVAQAPEFAREYLAWELVKASVWMWSTIGLLVVLLLMTAMFFFFGIKDGDDTGYFAGCWFTVFSIVMAFFVVANILDVAKIRTAPNIVLVEYAKSLVK